MDITTAEYAPPFDIDEQVQPASIDLRVDRVFWRRQRLRRPIDLTNRLSATFSSRPTYKSDLGARGKFRLAPGDIVMTRTLEEFTIPEGYSAEIFTRSSFGRLGLSVTCAGYINPGYRGHMPLQIANLGKDTIYFQPLISVCQLVVKQLTRVPERTYGSLDLRSKYANDDGGPSRWWMDSIIRKNQQSLGATNMPEEAQEALLSFMLQRDLSTQLRFEQFLAKAKAVDLETRESTLDAFAQQENRSMMRGRILTGGYAVLLALVGASIGAVFSTPFNEMHYSPFHIALWLITIAAIVYYVPVTIKKLTARETDFLLLQDLDAIRVRTGNGATTR